MSSLPSRDDIRLALADALRNRVVGPDADTKLAMLNDTSEPGWFAEDRPIRRVHADASMFIGGIRAILLQSLHPLAMAGVAQHSDYRNDPWGRLQRTADFLAATSFGSDRVAQQAVDRVLSVHTRVHGTAADGRAYSAQDPHLLLWVHVVEIDSFLHVHQLFGESPLDQDGRDAYVEDTAVIARKLGIPSPPTSEKELQDELRSFRPELASTRNSRDAAKYLLLQPPLSLPERVPYSLIATAAIATLPRWARADLRLLWLPLTERFALRPMGAVITRTIRWAIGDGKLDATAD